MKKDQWILTPKHTNVSTDYGFSLPHVSRHSYSKMIQTPDTLLTESDKEMYGDWEPVGYTKISLLGKGGAAIVWLAKSKESGEKVALKQFAKKGDTSSVFLEIEISNRL